MKPSVQPFNPESSDPATQEQEYVHAVYERIAPHFSATRYKPWPLIASFLSSLRPGLVGLDSGTGNGKYLSLNNDGRVMTIGMDRSLNLLEIAKGVGEVVRGDAIQSCWRRGVFDYAISIATIHHLTTADRRMRAVQTLLKSVKRDGGRIIIYVWSTQQDSLSKRRVPTTPGLPTEAANTSSDMLVPWISSSSVSDLAAGSTTEQRFYHFFRPGELGNLVQQAAAGLGISENLEVVQEGWERSNDYIELQLHLRGGTI